MGYQIRNALLPPSDVCLDFVAFPSRVSKQVKRSLPMTFGNLTTQPFFCTSVGKASEISWCPQVSKHLGFRQPRKIPASIYLHLLLSAAPPTTVCEHCCISQPGRIHLHPPLSLKTIKSLTKPIQRTAVPMSRGNFSTWNQYCIFSVVVGSWPHWGLSNNLLIAMSWMSLSHGTHIWFMPSALSCAALTLWWWCNWHIILLTHTGAENKSRVCASPLGTVG